MQFVAFPAAFGFLAFLKWDNDPLLVIKVGS